MRFGLCLQLFVHMKMQEAIVLSCSYEVNSIKFNKIPFLPAIGFPKDFLDTNYAFLMILARIIMCIVLWNKSHSV